MLSAWVGADNCWLLRRKTVYIATLDSGFRRNDSRGGRYDGRGAGMTVGVAGMTVGVAGQAKTDRCEQTAASLAQIRPVDQHGSGRARSSSAIGTETVWSESVGQHQDGGDPARGVGEVLHLCGQQRAAQHPALAVRQPLFEDLVAAELVVPDRRGHVPPVGPSVQVHVEGVAAEDRRGFAQRGAFTGVVRACSTTLAGHDRLARPEMAPAGGHGEVVAGHVVAVVVLGTATRATSGRNEPVVTPATGVSESSNAASSRPRAADAREFLRRSSCGSIGPAGQRDAGPFHPERAGVGRAVLGYAVWR